MSVQLQGIEELRALVKVPRWREVKGEPRPWYPRQKVYVADFRKEIK